MGDLSVRRLGSAELVVDRSGFLDCWSFGVDLLGCLASLVQPESGCDTLLFVGNLSNVVSHRNSDGLGNHPVGHWIVGDYRGI